MALPFMQDGKSALILAAEGGHPDVVTKLMDGKGKWSVNNTDKVAVLVHILHTHIHLPNFCSNYE